MQLSARNQLMGTVVDVTKGQTTAHVRINVNGTRLMATITNEAVDELRLMKGNGCVCDRQGERLHGRDRLHGLGLTAAQGLTHAPAPMTWS